MKLLYTAVISLLFCASVSDGQVLDSLQHLYNYKKAKDTLEFRYHFEPQDTLFYTAVGFDSIMIEWGDILLRKRMEKVRIVCDSVKAGRFFLSQTLIDFNSTESTADEQNVKRETSNWLNRTVWYEMDSVGNKYSMGSDNDSLGGQTIGGAFNPRLFFSFGANKKAVDESWKVKTTEDWIENGIPVSLVRETKLYLLKYIVDTLGYNSTKLTFISTAQGSIEIPIKDKTMSITNVMAGSGELFISNEFHIPVMLFTTYEQKLTIHKPDGGRSPGMHYSNVIYYLDEFKSSRLSKAE